MLAKLYTDIHNGKPFIRDQNTITIDDYRPFDGGGLRTLIPHLLQELKQPITILDWGCGEALQWHSQTLVKGTKSLNNVLGPLLQGYYRYDPYHPLYSKLPTGTWDWIILADVLEHIPLPDLEPLFKQLLKYAHKQTKFWFTISTKPSRNSFITGENTHVTQQPVEWWIELLKQNIPNQTTALFDPKQIKY